MPFQVGDKIRFKVAVKKHYEKYGLSFFIPFQYEGAISGTIRDWDIRYHLKPYNADTIADSEYVVYKPLLTVKAIYKDSQEIDKISVEGKHCSGSFNLHRADDYFEVISDPEEIARIEEDTKDYQDRHSTITLDILDYKGNIEELEAHLDKLSEMLGLQLGKDFLYKITGVVVPKVEKDK